LPTAPLVPRTALVLLLALPAGCGGEDELAPVESGAELLGGTTTVFAKGSTAYALPARNLSSEHRDRFSLGDHFFNRNWVTAPASISGNDGLGPTFNATSCSACHFKDGRGAPPAGPGDPFLGLLLRLSVPGEDQHGGPLPEPRYGGQFNHRAILGVPPEGEAIVEYVEVPGQFGDGTPYSLRRPTYKFTKLGFGEMAPGVMVSPRVAPANFGLGLLEAIAEATLLANADEMDRDGDGISGRANYVWDAAAGRKAIGRFGWKANQPHIRQQTAGAFLGDIGITTSLFPGENCPPGQDACASAKSGGGPGAPELSDEKLSDVTLYGLTLAVPARRDVADPNVRRGEKLFGELGCGKCHLAKLTTGTLPELPELSGQVIRPFTDLLLHDMGPDLADGRPDFLANGNEWRTPPLWGVGLLEVVNRHTNLLHDGRARNLTEAILWHGGEGERARESFRALSKADRDALLAFLGSL
jgi:CxxC motif-containing protein (DUF1111 family)